MGFVPDDASSKKKKTESSHIEPSLRTMEGQLVFDKKTKDALIRGSEPGLMLAEQEIPGHVYSIRIKGAKKIEADAVILRLKTHIGAEYRPALIAEDIQKFGKWVCFQTWKSIKRNWPQALTSLNIS